MVKVGHLRRLERMLRALTRLEYQLQAKHGDTHARTIRASRRLDAEALRGVIFAIEAHYQESLPARAPAPAPAARAAWPFPVSYHTEVPHDS